MGAAAFLVLTPVASEAEILWSGDYETGNFLQWHRRDDHTLAWYAGVPQYGRPARALEESHNAADSYYGDGSLLRLVTEPVRQGRYAARFTVRSAANGAEPTDCDAGGNVCNRRRTELWAHRILPSVYNAMPYGSERWLSISHYVPEDWEYGGGSWGPLVFQVKPFRDGGGIGPCFGLVIKDHGWLIDHRWTDDSDYNSNGIPWQQIAEYSSVYPKHGEDGSDLVADFPDPEISRAALANLNRGGWTDWVVHVKFDARGSAAGGEGFLTVWKRAGDEDWVKVLHVEPRVVSQGGITYDRGICYNSPARTGNPGGFGVLGGLYMSKSQVWDLSRDRVVYNDNIKVGSEKASFESMSPDGSAPGVPTKTAPGSKPRPPLLIRN